jgi:RHS repeat-associated protein
VRPRASLNGTIKRYVYNGARVLEETDDSGNLQVRYTTASGSYYAPLLHFKLADGTVRYPLYDGVGTVRRLVDGSDTITDAYNVDAFGRQTSSSGTTPNPYRYGGAWGYMTDTPGSGLLQLGARYYWPEVARFIQQDPMGVRRNRYAYVGNRPVRYIDPAGLWEFGGEAYFGGGGGFWFGKDPCTGQWFIRYRAGLGFGWGGGLNPGAGLPGGGFPAQGAPGFGLSGGVSANVGTGIGPLGGSAGSGVGFKLGPTGVTGYKEGGFTPGFGLGAKWGASAGFDVGIVAITLPF